MIRNHSNNDISNEQQPKSLTVYDNVMTKTNDLVTMQFIVLVDEEGNPEKDSPKILSTFNDVAKESNGIFQHQKKTTFFLNKNLGIRFQELMKSLLGLLNLSVFELNDSF